MKEASEKIFLDTNILIYAYDKDSNKKHVKAKEIVDSCFEGNSEFYISNQVLAEFMSFLNKKSKQMLQKDEKKEIIEEINKLNSWKKINYNTSTVQKSLIEKSTDFWDNLIASTMKENNVFTIYTENTKDFEKIERIKAINPL